MSSEPQKNDSTPKPVVRTHTPRPDEMSRESFEFIAAVDDYKRRHMRSFLTDEEVLRILFGLGYGEGGRGRADAAPTEAQLEAFDQARQRYRTEKGRLFPTWSELFALLMELGYRRGGASTGHSEAA